MRSLACPPQVKGRLCLHKEFNMCGRFTLTTDPEQLQIAFPWVSFPLNIKEFKPHYNIAPTQPVAVIPNTQEKKLDFFVWGLIPYWAKDPKIGSRLINARAESLSQKPSFRNAFRRRRCLILADGFYEWKLETNKKTKIPYYVRMKNHRPFGLAGLWELWHGKDGSVIKSCSIITTTPNALLEPIHNRMPAIISPNAYEKWLATEEKSPDELQSLLISYPPDEMDAFPVSRFVNNPVNDTVECITPLINR